MNKAIKCRIYPTTEQKTLINKTFGCCRKVWNLMLEDKVNSYKETKSFGAFAPATYKTKYEYLKEVDSLALANVWTNLNNAFNNCFKSKHCKFPKFKSAKNSRKSYTTFNQKGTIEIIDDKHIKLPKLKTIKAKVHRLPDENWVLKSATISQDSDGKYYVSILFEFEKEIKPISKNTDKVIGLDYSSKNLYVDDKGNIGTNHKYYKESMSNLAKQQRKLKHKKVGSNNYYKQQAKVNKIHKHISNQRLDNLHKISTAIAKQYDVVCIENISIKELLKSHEYKAYHRSTYDNGWYMFTQMLDYKLKDRGKYLIKVDKTFPSSKKCSVCGFDNQEITDDSIRKWECPHCHTKHDRDINAAINIKKEGMRLLMSA